MKIKQTTHSPCTIVRSLDLSKSDPVITSLCEYAITGRLADFKECVRNIEPITNKQEEGGSTLDALIFQTSKSPTRDVSPYIKVAIDSNKVILSNLNIEMIISNKANHFVDKLVELLLQYHPEIDINKRLGTLQVPLLFYMIACHLKYGYKLFQKCMVIGM